MFLRIWVLKSKLNIILKLIIVAMVNLVLMSCAPKTHVDRCNSLGNGLRINISGVNEEWLFLWSGRGVEKKIGFHSWQDFEYRLNIYRSIRDERSNKLPQDLLGVGMHLDVPFAVSHNGQLLISLIYPDDFSLILSKRISLIDLKNRKLLQFIEAGDYVWSLAWSLTDKYFAVLVAQDVTSEKWKMPGDWLSGFLGHPRQYYTLYVDIYNLDGERVCRKLLIENLMQGCGYIDWE